MHGGTGDKEVRVACMLYTLYMHHAHTMFNIERVAPLELAYMWEWRMRNGLPEEVTYINFEQIDCW